MDERPQRTVCCPYNYNHIMDESRLLRHLASGCQDKIKYGHLYSTCPFNSLHIIKKELMQEHIQRHHQKESKEQRKMEDKLGISQDDLLAAINKQFKQNKPNNNEKAQIQEKNAAVPGFSQNDNEDSSMTKKKRNRNKKAEEGKGEHKVYVEKGAKKDPEIVEWYKNSYGEVHSQKILNKGKAKDKKCEISFEEEWNKEVQKDEEMERKRRFEERQDNSFYPTDASQLSISRMTF